MEVQERKQTWEELERFNIQSRLRDLHQRYITMFEVDLEGLSEEQRKEIKDFFKSEVERLGRGIVAASDDTIWDRLKSFFTIAQSTLSEKIRNSKGGKE